MLKAGGKSWGAKVLVFAPLVVLSGLFGAFTALFVAGTRLSSLSGISIVAER